MLKKVLQYYSDKFVSRWFVLAFDLTTVLGSLLLAYLIRYHIRFEGEHIVDVLRDAPLVLASYGLGFLISRSYVGVIRHTSLQDSFRMFRGSMLGVTLVIFATLLFRNIDADFYPGVPHSITLIHFLLSLFLLLATRFAGKALYLTLRQDLLAEKVEKTKTHVLVYGAGQSGQITRNSIESEGKSSKKVIAFIDDNPSLQGKSLNGLPILSRESAFNGFIEKKKIDEVIISIQNIGVGRKQVLINECLAAGLRVKNVPPVDSWINGELSAQQIKDVQIEELLGREVIKLEQENLRRELTGKSVMITGGGGSIGSEIVRQVFEYRPKFLILIDQAESPLYEIEQELRNMEDHGETEIICFIGDVTNRERMRHAFETYRPDILYHAAAYKHVPLMEGNPIEAIQTNVFGTKNLADLSIEFAVKKFVMVSTDKAVNPTNVMGATKRAAEMYCRVQNSIQDQTRFITTRFGNVLGSNGSVIPLFRKQIANGGPVMVTHPEITRYFMTIPEACSLVLEAGSMGKGGEVFIFDMGESIKIIDLAHKMIQLSGLTVGKDIEVKFTGLRPGEKLYEELLASKEGTLPTHNEKIMVAQIQVQSTDHIERSMANLEACLEEQSASCLVGALKDMVPEYKSQNSVFEVLDKA